MFVFNNAHSIKEIVVHFNTMSIQFIIPGKGAVEINGSDEIMLKNIYEILGILKFFVRVTESPFIACLPPGDKYKTDIHFFDPIYAEEKKLKPDRGRMAKKMNPLR